MSIFSRRLVLLCLGACVFASPAQAWHKRHASKPGSTADLATPAPEPPALPAETAPQVKLDAPPSVSLQPFVDKHLGSLLAPLGQSAFAQPEVIASLKASYADGLAAAPDTHRPAYTLAQNVCDAMAAAITERQNAVSALRGALATRSSEAVQPKGGGQAVAQAQADDQFFLDSQKNNWTQRAIVLRQNITDLYLRERTMERQIGVWSPPSSAPVTVAAISAPAVAAPTPSVSAPAPPAVDTAWSTGQDPVVGDWTWDGRQLVTLKADHTVDGMRHGTWWNASTAAGRRDYEVHWNKHGESNYLVLSDDGKFLDGKDAYGGHVVGERR